MSWSASTLSRRAKGSRSCAQVRIVRAHRDVERAGRRRRSAPRCARARSTSACGKISQNRSSSARARPRRLVEPAVERDLLARRRGEGLDGRGRHGQHSDRASSAASPQSISSLLFSVLKAARRVLRARAHASATGSMRPGRASVAHGLHCAAQQIGVYSAPPTKMNAATASAIPPAPRTRHGDRAARHRRDRRGLRRHRHQPALRAEGGLQPRVRHPAHAATTCCGILSLIVWSMVWVITLKYLVVMMRADNNGEGGILALLALALRETRRRPARSSGPSSRIGIFGAAMFYGDSMITPAISVLSAVEGLEDVLAQARALRDPDHARRCITGPLRHPAPRHRARWARSSAR